MRIQLRLARALKDGKVGEEDSGITNLTSK